MLDHSGNMFYHEWEDERLTDVKWSMDLEQ
jgi:hypothetical protein